jgi:hypothetical protein
MAGPDSRAPYRIIYGAAAVRRLSGPPLSRVQARLHVWLWGTDGCDTDPTPAVSKPRYPLGPKSAGSIASPNL